MSWLAVTILGGSAVSALSFEPTITRPPLYPRTPVDLQTNQHQKVNDVNIPPLKYVDRGCAESWLRWGSANAEWSARAKPTAAVEQQPNLTAKPISPSRTSRAHLMPMGVTYAACDGIPRIKMTSYSSKWVEYDAATSAPAKTKGLGPYPTPPPTCKLSDIDCDDEWAALSQDSSPTSFKWFWNFSYQNNDNGTSAESQPNRFFGCDPPLDVCRSHNVISKKESCHVNAHHIAVLYWPPELKTRDTCARDGRGLYIPKEPKGAYKLKKPVVVKTNIITFTKEWNEAKGTFVTATMTGDFTFTSPTAYVAYQSLNALDACTQYGQQKKSGVIPVNRPIQTLARVFKGYRGTPLRMAKALGNGSFPKSYDSQLMYKPLNFADLQEPIRAGAYFEYDTNCEAPDQGCIITEGNYRPIMTIPGLLKQLDPAWGKCTLAEGAFDPPIAIETGSPSEPTALLPEGVSSISITMPATPASFAAHPAPTHARPMPVEPVEDLDDSSLPVTEEDSSPPKQTMLTSMHVFDPGEGRLLELIFNAGGKPVVATYVTGPAPSLVLPTATISIGGPEAMVNGEALSLQPKGLVVGSKTISLQAVAPINPTDSAAVFTWDSKTITFIKHAGDPAYMTVGSLTLSVGGPAITTAGHTVSLNTRGELIVDGTETVDPTPTSATRDGLATVSSSIRSGVAAAESPSKASTSRNILTAPTPSPTISRTSGGSVSAETSSMLLMSVICFFLGLLYIL